MDMDNKHLTLHTMSMVSFCLSVFRSLLRHVKHRHHTSLGLDDKRTVCGSWENKATSSAGVEPE